MGISHSVGQPGALCADTTLFGSRPGLPHYAVWGRLAFGARSAHCQSVCLSAFLSVRAGGVERQAAGPAAPGVLVLVAGRAGRSQGRSSDLLLC